MTTLTLDPKYIELLQPFGNIHEVLAEAIKRYALERINERIDLARQKVLAFEAKYGFTYSEFCDLISTDEAFLAKLETIDCTWEADLNSWEFYTEDLALWLGRLKKYHAIFPSNHNYTP